VEEIDRKKKAMGRKDLATKRFPASLRGNKFLQGLECSLSFRGVKVRGGG